MLIAGCETCDGSSGVGTGLTGVALEAGTLGTKDVAGLEEGSAGAWEDSYEAVTITVWVMVEVSVLQTVVVGAVLFTDNVSCALGNSQRGCGLGSKCQELVNSLTWTHAAPHRQSPVRRQAGRRGRRQ